MLQCQHVVGVAYVIQLFLLHESFKANRLVPVTAQNRLPVHSGHNAVDHFPGEQWSGSSHQHKNANCEL